MKAPKMIIFDYGLTLLCEPNWNSENGNRELLKYVTKNPNNCTIDDIKKATKLIFNTHVQNVRNIGYDVSAQIANRTVYEYLGMEFSLTPLEMETVFWDAASSGDVMPNADTLLDYLNRNNIKSAVISNLLWSGEALQKRFDRLLPNNKFEFVMTSSDYFLRKPNSVLFEIALQKSGLNADEIWYCGDNPVADINGAVQVGMYPVWYDNFRDYEFEGPPQGEYLHIKDWNELIDVLKNLEVS